MPPNVLFAVATTIEGMMEFESVMDRAGSDWMESLKGNEIFGMTLALSPMRQTLYVKRGRSGGWSRIETPKEHEYHSRF